MSKQNDELEKLLDFLEGKKEYKGRWFGDKTSGVEGAYWWRRDMRNIIEEDIENRVNEALEVAIVAVKEDLRDMKKFIAALLIQSGGQVTVTKRTLEEIPTPSKIKYEQIVNIDGSITMALEKGSNENNY